MWRLPLTRSLMLLLAVTVLNLSGRGYAQDSGSTITLNRTPSSPLPVLMAPNNLTGSLHFMMSYSLNRTGSLAGVNSTNFTVAANSTLVVKEFGYVSCVTMQLSASNSAVYGFATKYFAVPITSSSGQQDIQFAQPSQPRSGSYYASDLLSNGTISRVLAAAGGSNATTASGAVPTSIGLADPLTLVIVNPTSSSVSVTLEVGLSPLGPCNTCSTQRDSDGLLGDCGTDLTNATYILNNTVASATSVRDFLQPIQLVAQDLDQGASSVFGTFTNAACMLYTLKLTNVPSNLSLSSPQLTAWVATSAQQQQILSSGNVTLAQRLTLGCSYPATTERNRPCYNFSQTLDPSETYYVWVQNTNSSAANPGGNVSAFLELMVLRDTADCNQARLLNLSVSFQYLINEAGTPLNYTQSTRTNATASTIARSPYDPGVAPSSFAPGLSVLGYVFTVLGVGLDGSLSQAGLWAAGLQAGAYVEQVNLGPTYNIVLNRTQSRQRGLAFSNAACFFESLTSNNAVTSYLLPRSTFISNYDFSDQLPTYTGLSANAYNSRVAGSGHYLQTDVSATTSGLSPAETYNFIIEKPSADNTTITTRTIASPVGSSNCPNSTAQSTVTAASVGAVRGVADNTVLNYNNTGGASVAATITNAACIAFVISARGLSLEGSGPPLSSQYYNISSPGNSTSPDLSGSAILLQGTAINQQFLLTGFVNSTSSLPITAGCLVNYTSPGPCVAYADNLNSSEFYYLWGVGGAKSPDSYLLISFEARASGSCKDAFLRPLTAASSTAPPFTVVTPRASSSKTSVGVIVGPVVGALVGIAAIVLLVVCLKKRSSAKQLPPASATNSSFNAFGEVDQTQKYVNYSDLLGTPMPTGSSLSALKTAGTETRTVSVAEGPHTQSTLGMGNTGLTNQGPGPAEIVANVAAAAEAEQHTPVPTQSGAMQPPPMVLEQGNRWELKLSDLKLKTGPDGKAIKLGEGGFGSVYLGFLGVREVAVKIATGTSAMQRENFLREIQTLKGCRDLNIVNFLGASVGEQIVLLMEFMPGGDLYKAIRGDVKNHFRWRNSGATIALDIVKGLYHLHSNNVIHLDLKSPNILLSEDWKQGKISDVGLAKFTTDAGTRPEQGLSVAWASPEHIWGTKCTTASDMFSFGVVLWEICTGESPNERRIFRSIEAPAECPQDVVDLVAQCMHSDPTARPTAQEAHQVLSRCARSQSRDISSL